jgi:hypothetical protein
MGHARARRPGPEVGGETTAAVGHALTLTGEKLALLTDNNRFGTLLSLSTCRRPPRRSLRLGQRTGCHNRILWIGKPRRGRDGPSGPEPLRVAGRPSAVSQSDGSGLPRVSTRREGGKVSANGSGHRKRLPQPRAHRRHAGVYQLAMDQGARVVRPGHATAVDNGNDNDVVIPRRSAGSAGGSAGWQRAGDASSRRPPAIALGATSRQPAPWTRYTRAWRYRRTSGPPHPQWLAHLCLA